MSAITVIYHLNKRPVEEREMRNVLDRLKHRGEDDQGIWIEANVGLGHRMRWTTPESLYEKLPLKSAESSSVITCDARIDNRDELIPQVGFSNRPVKEITDAEIILKAYDKWGEECIQRFVGDFVFAIWNPKEQKLVCARDSMGIKHFYYYYKPGEIFVIASEAKAIFGFEGIPRKLNETNIGDILILNYHDKENTPFQDIKRLPANNALEVSPNGLKIWQYWYPKTESRKFQGRTNKYYEEKFRELFTEAVKCRLRSAYPVGSLLSGGLDSSSISCVAGHHLSKTNKDSLETFSAIFPTIAEIDSRIDERKYIDSVISHIDCNPNFVKADAFSPLIDMDKLQWHTDHPIGAPNIFMDWALFKAAKSKNVRVLLSGFDGDSTVSYGYEAFSNLVRQGRWIRMIKDAIDLNKNMPKRYHNFKNLVWKQGFKASIPGFALQTWRLANGRPRELKKDDNLPSALDYNYESANPAFANKQNLKNRYFELTEKNYPKGVSKAEHHWNILCSGLFAYVLETFEKAGASFDLEPRYPFFDRRLIEFCINVPARQRVYKGWTRSLFRRAMTGIIPSDVQWRTDKANIGLSFKINMLKYGRKDVEETILDSTQVLGKYVDIEKLKVAYDLYKTDPLKYEREPMFILSSVYLSNWLRHIFEYETV